MFGKNRDNEPTQLAIIIQSLVDIHQKLNGITHDLQQIKTAQRASKKREKKTLGMATDLAKKE